MYHPHLADEETGRMDKLEFRKKLSDSRFCAINQYTRSLLLAFQFNKSWKINVLMYLFLHTCLIFFSLLLPCLT